MRRLFATLLDTAWIASLYFGLVHGVDGALNIGLFISWFMFAMSFFVFDAKVAETIAKIPTWAIARSVAFDFAALGLLVWHGWVITAVAVAWSCWVGFGAWAKTRKEQTA